MNIVGNYEPAELNLKAGFLAFIGAALFLIVPLLCFLLLPGSLHGLIPISFLIPIAIIVKVIIME